MTIRIQNFVRKYKKIPVDSLDNDIECNNSNCNTIIQNVINVEPVPVPIQAVEIIKQKDERIDILEAQMSKMSENIESLMSNFSSVNNQRVVQLEDELTTSKDTIREQEEIIRQDEEVKRNMGQKLYDVLLSLNNAQEEIERLRKANKQLQQKKKWFW